MKEIISGIFGLAVMALLFNALFPEVIQSIIRAVLFGAFIGTLILIVIGGFWLFGKFNE